MEKVTFTQEIHSFDIDLNRHVSNISYIRWLEIGRTELLKAVDRTIEEMAQLGFMPVLLETHIQYKKPLYFPDIAEIHVWITELTRITAWMQFEVYSQKTGELAAKARQRGIFVGIETNKPYRLSNEDVEAFKAVHFPTR